MADLESQTHFTLPPRERGVKELIAGIAFMSAGTAFFIILGVMLRFAHGAVFHTISIAAAGAGLFRSGWVRMFPSYAEVLVQGERLRCRDRAVSHKNDVLIVIVAVARLELERARITWKDWFPRGMRLSAEMNNGARLLVAQNYPPEALRQLAESLHQCIQSHQVERNIDLLPQNEAIVDVSSISPISRDVLTQPPDSGILVHTDGVVYTFKLRRSGPFHALATYLVFNILVLLFAGLLGLLLYWLFNTPKMNRPPFAVEVMAALALAMALVLSLLALAFHVYRRHSVLVVGPMEGDLGLICSTRGPLRSFEWSWTRLTISSIATREYALGNSFQLSQTNSKRYQVVVRPQRGRRRCVAQGSEWDMRWLATELRRILNAPNETRK